MQETLDILGELLGAGAAAGVVIAWLRSEFKKQTRRNDEQDKAHAEFEVHVDDRLDAIESRLPDAGAPSRPILDPTPIEAVN